MAEARKVVFVVEDDPKQREILTGYLTNRGYAVRSFGDAESALGALKEQRADLVLMDVRMPGMGGLEGLARIRELSPATPVVLLTAYADVKDAVTAMRRGAVDYLQKPIDLNELAGVVAENIGEPDFEARAEPADIPSWFVAASRAMRSLLGEVSLVAPTDATVLVTGESGTGKELVARLIHQKSKRSSGPFVTVNCSAIPENLVESELFGHQKGAFTGADRARPGRFETADGGTILLDEIGELPLGIQAKLLRVLEDGTYQRVGDPQTRRCDIRVIACTNRDLESEVEAGRFREDLFFRLNVFRLHLPPLRERPEEIEFLVRHFLKRLGRPHMRVSQAALRALEAYNWPGNVRELANAIERAAILAPGEIILPEHLPPTVTQAQDGLTDQKASEVRTLREQEREAILEALRRTGGNRTQAAKLLGISRRKLLYRLREYGVSL